jgi:hypothetical protein
VKVPAEYRVPVVPLLVLLFVTKAPLIVLVALMLKVIAEATELPAEGTPNVIVGLLALE